MIHFVRGVGGDLTEAFRWSILAFTNGILNITEKHWRQDVTNLIKFVAFERMNLKDWLKGLSLSLLLQLVFHFFGGGPLMSPQHPKLQASPGRLVPQDFTSAPAGESDTSAVHVGAGDCRGHSDQSGSSHITEIRSVAFGHVGLPLWELLKVEPSENYDKTCRIWYIYICK